MSRFCGEKNTKPILEAADHWRHNGLLNDNSIFIDKSLWKMEHLQALETYFINQPDEGEGNFFEKLQSQLQPTHPEVKQLSAEILWVMFLCPSNIKESKKREGIETIWSWSNESFPEDSPWLNDNVLAGIGSAGTGYNTNRWRELVFIIRLLKTFKEHTHGERDNLLNNGWDFAKWLEKIPECNSRQFRHMILFLLFPDNFERIFGGTDRKEVVTAFSNKSKTQVNVLSAFEIDQELASIRRQQEQAFGTTEIDFYWPPLRNLWKNDRNVTWLLNWNPNIWPWENLAAERTATHEGKTVTHKWRCASHQAMVGDMVYLVRSGVEPKGIIATGNIVTASYEDIYEDEPGASEGKTRWYVDVSFSRIQDPTSNDPYLTSEDLKNITIDNQIWFPQASGIEIKQRPAGILKKKWDEMLKSGDKEPPKKELTGVDEATNLILYGPPGTGKTYQLNKIKERYSSKKQKIRREAWLTQQLLDTRWFDAIFTALFDLGKNAKVKDIVNHEYIQLKARAMGRYQNISNTIWATLQAHTIEESQTVQYKNKSAPFVFDKDRNGFWSLVGDWEDECAEQVKLAEKFKSGPQEESIHHRYEFVTFHQAYSYEDFVEGIRPVTDDETGNLTYAVVPGVFQQIAFRAKSDPKNRYAILIDEINRGNIAKIFGELITLIETDKRAVYSEDGTKLSGMELTLPYSCKKFGVPKNLDLYGTMNTADRSIALLDTALRRRFNFKEMLPDAGLINGSGGDGYIEDGEGGTINLRALLTALNKRIHFLLNRDLTIGHSYFMEVDNFIKLKNILLSQIIPLLQEYFYEDWHRIQLVFRDVRPGGEKLEPQIICHENLKRQDVLGFDHDDFEDLTVYRVAAADDIIPDSLRKIYEEPA